MCNKRTIPFLMKLEAAQSKIDGIIKNKKERVGLEKQKNLIMIIINTQLKEATSQIIWSVIITSGA